VSDQSYVLMSIGPVQGYIQQARRTQDLFAGSRLLSLLAETAIDAITSGLQSEQEYFVYPNRKPKSKGSAPNNRSTPNRFLFRCDSSNAKKLAEAARTAVYKRWNEISTSTKRYLSKPTATSDEVFISDEIWTRQAGSEESPAPWIEIHYVISEVVQGEAYKVANAKLNRLLAARKLFRNFSLPPEPGFKCSVTGEHEALHSQSSGKATNEQVREYWDRLRGELPNKAILSEGERLCALSAIKRFAHEADQDLKIERFPSTSSIAAAPFRKQVLEQWGKAEAFVRNYLSALKSLVGNAFLFYTEGGVNNQEHFPHLKQVIRDRQLSPSVTLTQFMSMDGDFFYEEALQGAALKEYVPHVRVDPAKQNIALKALHELYEAVDARPSSYLAVLAMDGDGMGKIVQNFRLTSQDPTTLEESGFQEDTQHTALSETLADFAENAVYQSIERDVPGRVIYAGGDDLLAMLPLENACATAETIRKAFAKALSEAGFGDRHMSAGIAIVHRTHALQDAIQAAKAAEHDAKHTLGRDAFAVRVLRRSGEEQHGGAKWDANRIPTLDLLERIRSAMVGTTDNKQLSMGIPYDMEAFLYALVEPKPDENSGAIITTDYVLRSEMRELEFKRIFKRRCSQPYRDDPASTELRKDLTELGESGAEDGHAWEDVAVMLRLARFIAQEAK
jgi:CRISPR-associated protein Cmr2